MKKAIILALLLCQYVSQAQNISYSLSEEFEAVKKYTYEETFFKFDDNSYGDVFCRDGKSITIQFFDKNFDKLVKEVEIPLPEELKDYTIWKFIKIKNKYFLFCHTYEKKHGKMFAYEFDAKTLSFLPNPVTLVDTDNIGGFSYYKFDISKDSTKILIWFVGRHDKVLAKKYNENISFNTYDENMKKIYSGDIEMPYTDKDMNIIDCKIDHKGDIYALTSVYENNSVDGKNASDKNSMRIELMKVNQKQNNLGFIKIAVESKYIFDAQLFENAEKDMMITGYYSNQSLKKPLFTSAKEAGRSVDGVYFYKVGFDESNKVKDPITSYTEFPLEMLAANASEKEKQEEKEKNDELEQNNLQLRQIISSADGSMTVIGEEYYFTTSTYYSNNKSYTQYTYHYNDILVVKMDKQGKILWHQRIKKDQTGTSKNPLSFYRGSVNGNSYFLYLNNGIDPELKNKVPEGKLKGTFLTVAKLDQKGNLSKDLLYIDDKEVEFNPQYFESIEPGVILKIAHTGKKTSKLLKIGIK